MLKIGEFARICQVSIKALRHYDALGLLQPAQIDPESGYRYYAMSQLADVLRIQALKDCGFALEEIGQLLQTHDTPAIEELLGRRMADQQRRVAEEQERLRRLSGRLQQLRVADDAPYFDIALKQSEAMTLVGRRQRLATTEEIGPCARAVVAELAAQGIGFARPIIHLYYDLDEPTDTEQIDLYIGAPVAALPAEIGAFTCVRLPANIQLACVIYRGDYPSIGLAYRALEQWIVTCGYQVAGPCLEVYHISPAHTDDPAAYLTEIQFPIVARQSAP
jgi:DNA-binding transcriptional MerR regulator